MTMQLQKWEVPVADSMISLIRISGDYRNRVFENYMLLWVAFNNVYVTLAEKDGCHPKLKQGGDGLPKYRLQGHVQVPDVKTVTEREQIEIAIKHLSDATCDDLVRHPSVEFFVNRIPIWKGELIRNDKKGQVLNGVINIGRTLSYDYPVWSSIDPNLFANAKQSLENRDDVRTLAEQIIFLLYTVRNNLFHGGKRADDANDVEVVKNATPLLRTAISSFISI